MAQQWHLYQQYLLVRPPELVPIVHPLWLIKPPISNTHAYATTLRISYEIARSIKFPVHTCMCTHNTHVCACTHAHIHTCTQHTYMTQVYNTHINFRHTHTHARTCAYTHICTYTCTCTCKHTVCRRQKIKFRFKKMLRETIHKNLCNSLVGFREIT